jgi:hypothetical protein
MQWVRSASWLLASVSVLACTRDNPAFEDGGDELVDEGETRLETGDGDTTTETGTVAECEYDEGQGVTIVLPMPCGETNEQTQRYERSFLIVSSTETGWLGGLCEVGDVDCTGECPTNVPQAIEIEGFDVTGLVGAGACLRISAEQSDPASDSCSFDAIGIWHQSKPVVVASNGAVVIGEALADAGQIAPTPALAEEPPCECIEACCEVSPGDYRFDISGQKVDVGAPIQLEAHPYRFHPLRAYNPTGCADDLQQAWGLTYSP